MAQRPELGVCAIVNVKPLKPNLRMRFSIVRLIPSEYYRVPTANACIAEVYESCKELKNGSRENIISYYPNFVYSGFVGRTEISNR